MQINVSYQVWRHWSDITIFLSLVNIVSTPVAYIKLEGNTCIIYVWGNAVFHNPVISSYVNKMNLEVDSSPPKQDVITIFWNKVIHCRAE